MATATGTRLAAAVLFLIGGFIPIIGWIFIWPIAYKLYKDAGQKEAEAEKRQEFYEQNVD